MRRNNGEMEGIFKASLFLSKRPFVSEKQLGRGVFVYVSFLDDGLDI